MEIAEGEGEGDGRSTIGGDGGTVAAAAGGGRRGRSSGMGEGEEDQSELLSHSGTPFFAIVFEESLLSLYFSLSTSLSLSCALSFFIGREVKTKRSPVYSWLAGLGHALSLSMRPFLFLKSPKIIPNLLPNLHKLSSFSLFSTIYFFYTKQTSDRIFTFY